MSGGFLSADQEAPKPPSFLLSPFQFNQGENNPLQALRGGVCLLWDAESAGAVVFCSHALGWQATAGLSQVTLSVTLPYKGKSNL